MSPFPFSEPISSVLCAYWWICEAVATSGRGSSLICQSYTWWCDCCSPFPVARFLLGSAFWAVSDHCRLQSFMPVRWSSTPSTPFVKSFKLQGNPATPKPAAFHRLRWRPPMNILTNCFGLGLSAVARAVLLLLTWPRRNMARGVLAEIIGSSTNKLSPTVIHFYTFKMSSGTWMTAAFSRQST